jgi:hypothetical protein
VAEPDGSLFGTPFGALWAFLVDELEALTKRKGPDDLVFTASDGGVLRESHWTPPGIREQTA